MKTIIIAISAFTLTAAWAWADLEFDYPTEYAGLFEEFKPITPEEAQMWVSVEGDPPGGSGGTGVILEPILLKCLDGMPGYYIVLSYEGNDTSIRDKAEEMISLLNNDGGFDPADLMDKFDVIHEHRLDFSTYIINAWPWYQRIIAQNPTLAVDIITDYRYYENKAREEFGPDYLNKVHLNTPGLEYHGPMLGFEKAPGEVIYLLGNFDVANREEVEKMMEESLELRYGAFVEERGDYEAKKRDWTKLLNRIKNNAVKRGAYYEVIDKPEEGVDGYNDIDDVPDFNQNETGGHGDACWRYALTSIYTYWSQQDGWIFVKNTTIPPPDCSLTSTIYGKKIYNKFTDWIIANHPTYLNSGAEENMAVLFGNDFTEYCEFVDEIAWKYEAWVRGATASQRTNITIHPYTQLPFTTVQFRINEGFPMWGGFDAYNETPNFTHAVPIWGYNTSTNKVMTWNLKGDLYDPWEVAWPTGGLLDEIYGILQKYPDDPSVDPWVAEFKVDKDGDQAFLNWSVSSLVNVKGFNVFREGADGSLERLNDGLISGVGDDPSRFEYVDRKSTKKGSTYALELVRYTEEDDPYIVHEWEVRR